MIYFKIYIYFFLKLIPKTLPMILEIKIIKYVIIVSVLNPSFKTKLIIENMIIKIKENLIPSKNPLLLHFLPNISNPIKKAIKSII